MAAGATRRGREQVLLAPRLCELHEPAADADGDLELTDAAERIPDLLNTAGVQGAMQDEALWGADYLYRALSTDDYFYMVVFSFFSPSATDRRGVGLLADGMTNNKWQATFRAGGGMAIAALARISRWNKNGTYFTSQNYLDGAKRAFANLLVNNTRYIDDGKENIIDDYGSSDGSHRALDRHL